MNIKQFFTKENSKKLICIFLLLVMAVLSITVVSKFATNPETYSSTVKSIDDKKIVVMGVTATAAATSAALAAFPGDVTTPIANQIVNVSTYLLIVVCVLVLEKSLLSVFGYLSFTFLIPLTCVLLGIYAFNKKKLLKVFALKTLIFALVLVLIIPFSMKISDMIYEMNQTTVENVTAEEIVNTEDVDEKSSFIDRTLNAIKKGASDVGNQAKKILNSFIDAIALFIIAYCVLPIAIVFLVIWLINFLFGLSVPMPDKSLKKLLPKKSAKAELIEEKENIEV